MEKPYQRKQGDTYPIRGQLRDAAGIVDLSTATAIVLRIAKRALRSTTPDVVAQSNGASVAGEPGWAVFNDVSQIAPLEPAVYDGEISYTIGGKITTTKTFPFEILRQLG